MLERGGNAVDAALAASAMLCVTEPVNTGIGGDLFALVGGAGGPHGAIFGLDGAGPSPRDATPVTPVEQRGPRSTTVPGTVAGWAALSERFGKLGLDACLADAIDAAERGVPVSARSAALWSAEDPCPPEVGPTAPHPGQIVAMPMLARVLRRIADEGPSAIYEGSVARAVAAATWLTEQDLSEYRARWTTPLRASYRGYEVIELPPPTQGIVALEGLRLLEQLEPTLPNMVHCVRLALEDGAREVRDGADVTHLLDAAFLRARCAVQTAAPVATIDAGTSHLCAIDEQRMTVSVIQSLFRSFGSGVVAPGTGFVLQNRGACFSIEGAVRPGKRPYHTIIPALLVSPDGALGAFGVVGGHLQAQAHVQLVSALARRRPGPAGGARPFALPRRRGSRPTRRRALARRSRSARSRSRAGVQR